MLSVDRTAVRRPGVVSPGPNKVSVKQIANIEKSQAPRAIGCSPRFLLRTPCTLHIAHCTVREIHEEKRFKKVVQMESRDDAAIRDGQQSLIA